MNSSFSSLLLGSSDVLTRQPLHHYMQQPPNNSMGQCFLFIFVFQGIFRQLGFSGLVTVKMFMQNEGQVIETQPVQKPSLTTEPWQLKTCIGEKPRLKKPLAYITSHLFKVQII